MVTRRTSALRCAHCRTPTQVVQTAKVGRGIYEAVRRRRECPKCKRRFSTFELPEDAGPRVLGKRFSRVARALQVVADLRRVIGELKESP